MEGRHRGVLAHHQVQPVSHERTAAPRWRRRRSRCSRSRRRRSASSTDSPTTTRTSSSRIRLMKYLARLVARVPPVVLAEVRRAATAIVRSRFSPSASSAMLGHRNPMVFHAVNIALYAVAAWLVFLARSPPAAAVGRVGRGRAVRGAPGARRSGRQRRRPVGAVRRRRAPRRDGRSTCAIGCEGPLRPSTALWILLLYAVACFAKEHGIVLPAILVAAELTVISDASAPARARAQLRPFYLGARGRRPRIPRGARHRPRRSLARRIRSRSRRSPSSTSRPWIACSRRVGVVPEWLRLFFWPARLSSDYGPPDDRHRAGPEPRPDCRASLLLIAIIAAAFLLRRRQPVMSFGIAFACLALLPSSNFLLPGGNRRRRAHDVSRQRGRDALRRGPRRRVEGTAARRRPRGSARGRSARR